MAISFLPSSIHAFTFLRDHYRNWPKEAGKRLLAASSGPFNQDDPKEFFFGSKAAYKRLDLINESTDEKDRTTLPALLKDDGIVIVLGGDTGSGKTTAQLQVTFLARDNPREFDWIPCWLDVANARTQENAPLDVLAELFSKFVDSWESFSTKQFLDLLRYSPNLAVFVDLNEAPPRARPLIAHAIRQLAQRIDAGKLPLRRHHDRTNSKGHCFVVALRAQAALADRGDRPLEMLCAAKKASYWTLGKLEIGDAADYIEQYWKRLGFVDSRQRPSRTQLLEILTNSGEAIQLPLLMHLFAVDGHRLPEDQSKLSVARLYDRIVRRWLELEKGKGLDQRQFAANEVPVEDKLSRDDTHRILIGLVRVAQYMFARGELTIERRVMKALLESPSPFAEEIGLDEFWRASQRSRYWTHQFTRNQPDLIIERSLLRKHSADRLAFVHDSFLYFLAAYGLRFHFEPGSPVEASNSTDWWTQVAKRLSQHTEVGYSAYFSEMSPLAQSRPVASDADPYSPEVVRFLADWFPDRLVKSCCIGRREPTVTVPIVYTWHTKPENRLEGFGIDVWLTSNEDGFTLHDSLWRSLDKYVGVTIRRVARQLRARETVTIAPLDASRSPSPIKGLLICSGGRSKCYERLRVRGDRRPHRDFYYNVFYEAFRLAESRWQPRRIGICDLAFLGDRDHEDIAVCCEEALSHFLDDGGFRSLKEVIYFSPTFGEILRTLQKIEHNRAAPPTSHRPIRVYWEERVKADVLTLDWTSDR